MKKIFTVLVLIMAIVNTLPLFAAKKISTAAWDQLRILHSQRLGRPNDTSHKETDNWIAEGMNQWINDRKNEYEKEIAELQGQIPKGKIRQGDQSSETEIFSTSNRHQKLKNELKYYKIFSWIVSSILGIIVVMFIAFILIKKCQAKKFPQCIEDAIAETE